jgi:hypothetical protein
VQAAPWWDLLYGASYIVRHVVHDVLGYTWLLLSPADLDRARQMAMAQLQGVLGDLAKLARERGAVPVLVVNPHEFELTADSYDPHYFKGFVEQMAAKGEFQVVELMPLFRKNRSITPENSSDFYWKMDLHFNEKGYQVMAETIACELVRRGTLEDVKGVKCPAK